jgi:hypothetical protein
MNSWVLLHSVGVQLSEVNSFPDLAKEIYQWLSPSDTSRNYNEACEKHHAETCSWFTSGTQFAEWKANADHFLWVYGMRKFFNRLHEVRLGTKLIAQLGAAKPSYGGSSWRL